MVVTRYKLGDTIHEAFISLIYFRTPEEAEEHNCFAKKIWRVTVENHEEHMAISKSCGQDPK